MLGNRAAAMGREMAAVPSRGRTAWPNKPHYTGEELSGVWSTGRGRALTGIIYNKVHSVPHSEHHTLTPYAFRIDWIVLPCMVKGPPIKEGNYYSCWMKERWEGGCTFRMDPSRSPSPGLWNHNWGPGLQFAGFREIRKGLMR